jgi:hypothetical protein
MTRILSTPALITIVDRDTDGDTLVRTPLRVVEPRQYVGMSPVRFHRDAPARTAR